MTIPMSRNVLEAECTRCGCCVSICPESCISLSLDGYPVIGEGCTSCGLCAEICPGKISPGREVLCQDSHSAYVGHYKNAYTGYSRDAAIRERATSGGVVTSLLVCLLEKKVIDGALVVTFDEKEPWKTRYILATSKNEIIDSAQTKYQVTPLNVQLNQVECNKLAVVGLPCVIQGLRRIQEKSKVGEKIAVLIGLFCWVNMEREATEFLLRKLHVDRSDVKSIEYRSGDYLGGFKVVSKNGDVTFLGKECYNILPFLFAPDRCLYCPDFTNEMADISVGDAKFLKSEKGHTFIITRSEKGEEILKNCRESIHTESSTVEEIVWSESSALFFKRGAYKRKNIEYKESSVLHIPLRNRLFELLFVTVHKNRKFFQNLVSVMPLSFFRVLSQLITRERS